MIPPPPRPTLFPYTTLFRSWADRPPGRARDRVHAAESAQLVQPPDRAAGAIEHRPPAADGLRDPHLRWPADLDRKSTRLNSSHTVISYAVFCLKKKKTIKKL